MGPISHGSRECPPPGVTTSGALAWFALALWVVTFVLLLAWSVYGKRNVSLPVQATPARDMDRAERNWRRFGYSAKQIFKWRRLWSTLGEHLRNFTSLKPHRR